MKKYVLQTATIGGDGTRTAPAFVEPGIHRPISNLPAVKAAVRFLCETPEAEGVWLRVGTRAYALTVYEGDRPELDDHSYPLEIIGGEDDNADSLEITGGKDDTDG